MLHTHICIYKKYTKVDVSVRVCESESINDCTRRFNKLNNANGSNAQYPCLDYTVQNHSHFHKYKLGFFLQLQREQGAYPYMAVELHMKVL